MIAKRILSIATAVCILSVPQLLMAQQHEQVVVVRLHNAPYTMEPESEPKSIRVDNRGRATILLEGLSPLDVCSLGGRTTTPTTETNPLASLITSISALGAFLIPIGSVGNIGPLMEQIGPSSNKFAKMLSESKVSSEPLIADPLYTTFVSLNRKLSAVLSQIKDEQDITKKSFESDQKQLASYLSADYRGNNWQGFNPRRDLTVIAGDAEHPMKSVADLANAQANYERISNLVSSIHKKYDDKLPPSAVKSREALKRMDPSLTMEKAALTVLADNNTVLKDPKAKLQAAYDTATKAFDTFARKLQRVNDVLPNLIREKNVGYGDILTERFRLAPDRKTTVTGVLSCVSSLDLTTPTTDAIDYSVLYQDVPHLTASAGILTSFIQKQIVGTTEVNTGIASATSFATNFAITDLARVQVIPMAFVNYRILNYKEIHWPNQEDDLGITTNLSGGFGINPNTGTNQPEGFFGIAIGFNRVMVHTGLDIGRVQHLGGGFTLGNPVPMNFPSPVPLTWTYEKGFSIGFSVRVAPF